jgi:hypothetical protein
VNGLGGGRTWNDGAPFGGNDLQKRPPVDCFTGCGKKALEEGMFDNLLLQGLKPGLYFVSFTAG